MNFINWLNLQPSQTDLDALTKSISEPLHSRKVRQNLVEITLQGYPWKDRPDIIPGYHPSNTFDENEWIALPIHDVKNTHPLVWQIAKVKKSEMAENPIQGSFQVLTLEIYGLQIQLACGLPNAPFPSSDLSQYSPQDLDWLVEWIEDAYATALQPVLENLVNEGKLRGKFTGDMYIHEQHMIVDNEESPPLIHHPAFYQHIWSMLIKFLQKLFRKKQ